MENIIQDRLDDLPRRFKKVRNSAHCEESLGLIFHVFLQILNLEERQGNGERLNPDEVTLRFYW